MSLNLQLDFIHVLAGDFVWIHHCFSNRWIRHFRDRANVDFLLNCIFDI